MKKILLLLSVCISFSSCCTLFSSSKQDITFTGMNGTKIYEASTKQKIAEIKEDNSVTVQIKKKREDKQLVAKKEGYQKEFNEELFDLTVKEIRISLTHEITFCLHNGLRLTEEEGGDADAVAYTNRV